jgi:hypothetical protein
MTLRIALLSFFLLTAAASAAAPDADQEFIRRGLYFTSADEGIAFWVPGWVNQSKNPRAGMTAEFGIKVMKRFIQMYVVVSGNTLDEIVERQRTEAKATFPKGKLELIQPLEGCTKAAALALFTDIDDVAGFEEKDFLVIPTRLAEGKSVTFNILTAKGHGKAILPVVRWLVNSLGPAGEARLAVVAGPRRLDPKAAVSYRLPPGLERRECPDGTLLAAHDNPGGETLSVRASDGDAVTELEKLAENRRSLRLIRRPHPDGGRLLLAYHPPPEGEARARVQAFVIGKDEPPLLVEVSGPATKRMALMDHAEIMAASLRRVDVEATRAAALEAAAALPKVSRTKDYARIHELVTALTSGSFVPEAREALAKSLPQLAAEEQVRAVDALATSHDADAAPPLIKLYRSGKTKKRPAVRKAILRALGELSDAAARKLLLGAAREKDDALAATAVRALGGARAHRAEVLRALVPLFKQAEAAGRSRNRKSRERWLALRPALATTLERLTGEAFESAKDAQEWYRKHKAEL